MDQNDNYEINFILLSQIVDKNNNNEINFLMSQIEDQNNNNEINFILPQIVDQNNNSEINFILCHKLWTKITTMKFVSYSVTNCGPKEQ